MLSPAAPLFDFERNYPELQKLDAGAKTYMGPRISRLAQRHAVPTCCHQAMVKR